MKTKYISLTTTTDQQIQGIHRCLPKKILVGLVIRTLSALVILAAMFLAAGSAHADAFADGTVKLDLSSYIYKIDGLQISGLGYKDGSKFEFGNAYANEFHELFPEFGHVVASTAVFGIAGARSTGSETLTLTNELDSNMSFNLDLYFDYSASTRVDGPQDTAKLGLLIDGQSPKGAFTIADFVLNNNDDPRHDGQDEYFVETLMLKPHSSVDVELHYELIALATSTPEPSSLFLIGSGLVSLGTLARHRLLSRT